MKTMDGVITRPRPLRQALPQVTYKKKTRRLELSFKLPKLNLHGFNPRKPLHLALAALIVLSVAAPILDVLWTNGRYGLSRSTGQVLGGVNANLASKVSYDGSKKLFRFNADGKKDKSQIDQLRAQFGGGESGADTLYSADLPQDSTQNFTLYDNVYGQTLSFKPLFKTMDGRQSSGRIVYPLSDHNPQLLYSFKSNGLKEDIVLPNYQGDDLTFEYQLYLPTGLEARMLDGGGVGIYSADQSLTANVQAATPADQQLLDNARANSQKTQLSFAIPAPVIRQIGGSAASAKFELDGNILKVHATGLKKASYPLSIDPSFLVASAGDFQNGNVEDNIDFDTTGNQIKRGGLSGGTVPAWTAQCGTGGGCSASNAGTYPVVAYNGYLYQAYSANIFYAPINSSTHAVGSWTVSSTINTSLARGEPQNMAAYNGYLYIINGTGTSNCVMFAKINLDHSVGTWSCTTSTGSNHNATVAAVAYNGYLYAIGGGPSSPAKTNEYAKINGDGTIGAWANVTDYPLTQGVGWHTAAAYNNRLYILGGWSNASGSDVVYNTVYYANINSDGTLGSWNSTTNLPGNRSGHMTYVYNGYIYVAGGCDTQSNGSSCQSGKTHSEVYYASINTDGSIGAWFQTTSFSTARWWGEGAEWNGYLYLVAGCSGGVGGCGTSFYTDIQYAKVDAAGTLRTSISSTSLPTPVWGGQTLINNGFIYVMGGCTVAPTYLAGLLQPCLATNIIGHGADTLHAQGTSGDRLTIQFAHLASDGSIDTSYTISGYTATNGWFTDKATCTEAGAVNADTCPGSRYAFAGVWHQGRYYVLSGRGGDLNGTSNGNSLTADVNLLSMNANGTPFGWNTGSGSGASCISGDGLTTAREFASGGLSKNMWGAFFVLGGRDSNGTPLTSIEYGGNDYNGNNTSNNACGWITGAATLPNGRWQTSVVSYNGLLFIIGGRGSGSTTYGDILAVTNANASNGVSTVCSPCTGLPSGIYGATAFANKGVLYVIGGVTNGSDGPPTAYSSAIYTASIDVNNNIGSFSAQPAALNSARYQANLGYDVLHDVIYQVGGVNTTGLVAASEYLPVNNGGSGALTWSGTSSDTGVQRAAMGIAQYKNFVYLVGGFNGSYLNTVQMGTISQTDGSVSWSTVEANTIPAAMAYNGAFVANGYLYTVGGRQDDANNGADVTNKIYRAPIDPTSGHLSGAFVDTGTTLNVPLEGSAVAAYNGYIYVLAGRSWPGGTETPTSSYEYAQINANGSLGSFTTAGTTGVAEIFGGNAVAGPGGIYIGQASYDGCTVATGGGTVCSNFTPTGYVGVANSNHTLTFKSDGATDIYQVQQAHVVIDGIVYGLGGGGQSGGGSGSTTVQQAPVQAGGGVSQQSWLGEGGMPVSRTWHAVFAYNGRVYVVGGCNSTTATTAPTYAGSTFVRSVCNGSYLSTENHASPSSIPRVGHYSRLMDLGADGTPTKMYVNGVTSSLPAVTSMGISEATNGSPTLSAQTSYSPIANNALQTVPTPSGGMSRYYWVTFAFDDSVAASYPDSSAQSTINDFELFFHPPTISRLRGGKSFIGGDCHNGSTTVSNCSLDASP